MLKGRRILIVDDVEAERMLISTYLQSHGCRIYLASDGVDGIHKARLVMPDLVLMDVDMPGCNGFAACKILAEDPVTRDIPVIFISGLSEPAQRVRGLMAGAVDYIGKPFDFDEVRLRLAVHLRRLAPGAGPDGEDGPAVEGRSEGGGEGEGGNHYRHELIFHAARIHLLKSLAMTPNLETLAGLAGTNSKRLNEAFRHCVGTTVFEYLREERMKEARQLLSLTALSIGDVALRVGFSSSANFSTAFRERYGITPSSFRQLEGGNTDEAQ